MKKKFLILEFDEQRIERSAHHQTGGLPYKSKNLLVYRPPQSRREAKCYDSKEGADIQCFYVLPPTSQEESFRELNAISLATQW